MKRLCPKNAPVVAIAAAAGLALAACAVPPPAAPLPERGVLFLRLGPDTMFVERFELTRDRLYVESVVRTPRVIFRTFDAPLNADGSFAAVRIAAFDAANPRGPARDSATITFSADSTFYALGIGDGKESLRRPGRGDYVLSFPGNVTFLNHLLLAARATRAIGDSLTGTMTSRIGSFPLLVKRVAPDTVTVFAQLAGLMRVVLGADGKVVGLDGTGSSLGYIGTRASWIDIDSVARAFAEQERRAGPTGSLSLRDTVVAEIGGARLVVDYGRPSKRGRAIFGNVVPFDRIWRTGANLATHFITDRPLDFNGVPLPEGAYTLHTIPRPDGWTLLVSSQTGQWGSVAPDPERFVARIPMRLSRAASVVETFTIAVDSRAIGGVLRMEWDDAVAEASFVVR
ncbi:MAG: DUF2911 domain-containing protein [Gemmatimonadaceae bacterium]|nr:DUF2911 domain-containing protein [Gemmatimonadaceae bacterium]